MIAARVPRTAVRRPYSLVAMVVAGCAPADPTGAIRGTLDGQVAAWNRGDIEGFMAAYWRSDDLTFVAFPRAVEPAPASQPAITRGWANVRERYRQRYPTRERMGRLRFEALDVRPIDRDTAMVCGRYVVQRGPETLTGLFVLDLMRTPEGWIIVRDRTYPD
jgi:hypothetical protein